MRTVFVETLTHLIEDVFESVGKIFYRASFKIVTEYVGPCSCVEIKLVRATTYNVTTLTELGSMDTCKPSANLSEYRLPLVGLKQVPMSANRRSVKQRSCDVGRVSGGISY